MLSSSVSPIIKAFASFISGSIEVSPPSLNKKAPFKAAAFSSADKSSTISGSSSKESGIGAGGCKFIAGPVIAGIFNKDGGATPVYF